MSDKKPLRHAVLEAQIRDRHRHPEVRVLVEADRLVIFPGEGRDAWRLADLLVPEVGQDLCQECFALMEDLS